MVSTKTATRLREQTAQLRSILASENCATKSVSKSKWCVAEHVDHILKVAISTLGLLTKPDLAQAPNGLNLPGRLVLILGWIPRGSGRSPERMRPTAATTDDLQTRINELESLVERVTTQPGARTDVPIVRHPKFGGLTYEQSLRFVEIHTHHHLKILRDALR